MGILTEKELAESLGISPWTVRKWRLSLGLPHFGTKGRIYYREEAVADWMKQEEQKNLHRAASKDAQSPQHL